MPDDSTMAMFIICERIKLLRGIGPVPVLLQKFAFPIFTFLVDSFKNQNFVPSISQPCENVAWYIRDNA